jgi:hypothetical protein
MNLDEMINQRDSSGELTDLAICAEKITFYFQRLVYSIEELAGEIEKSCRSEHERSRSE